MGEAVRARSSTVPEAGFRRYRFLFDERAQKAHVSYVLTNTARSAVVFDDSGVCVARMDDADPARAIAYFGEEDYPIVKSGARRRTAFSPAGIELAMVERASAIPHAVLKPAVLLLLAFAFIAAYLPADASTIPLWSLPLACAVALVGIALVSSRSRVRVTGADCRIEEGIGLGDYRLRANDDVFLKVFRDNGRSFDDYDVDVAENVDATTALLVVLAIETQFGRRAFPEVLAARQVYPVGPRPPAH